MNPVTLTTTIARPREEVFEYLADVANHSEFTDHYLTDWHLLRVDSYGRGAGARFRVANPFNRFGWADLTFVEVDPPRRIVAVGRGGKYNRVKTYHEWRLSPAAGGTTKVEYMTETEPKLPSDRIIEALGGGRGRMKRRVSRALKRLRSILEEDYGRGRRVTVAGL